ncbi:MAG: homoserine kinase, partial [Cyanobacteria bacterium J06607_13]
MPSSVTVTVPATTANIGPGFDCLGAALSLHNRFHFTPFTPL